MAATKPITLPTGYKTVQMEDLQTPAEREKAMEQVHKLLEVNYGEWAANEKPKEWLDELHVKGQEPKGDMTRRVSLVVNEETKDVVAFTSVEGWIDRANHKTYLFGGYSAAEIITEKVDPSHPGEKIKTKEPAHPDTYLTFLEASKDAAAKATAQFSPELEKAGFQFQPMVQEHKIPHQDNRPFATPKVEASIHAGQVPTAFKYHIPLYLGDMVDPNTGKPVIDEETGKAITLDKALQGEAAATLFLSPPENEAAKNQSYAGFLEGLAENYAKQHGYLKGEERKNDPFYKDMMAEAARAEKEHPGLTYGQAYEAAREASPDLVKHSQVQAQRHDFIKEHPIKVWDGANLSNIIDRLTEGKVTPAMVADVVKANTDLGKDPNLIHPGDTLHLESLDISDKGFKMYQMILDSQKIGLNDAAQNTVYSHITSHLDNQSSNQVAHNHQHGQEQQAAQAQAQDTFTITA